MNLFWIKSKQALAPLYRVWLKVGDTLGWINARIILGALFYLIITPIGLLLRLLGKGHIREHSQRQGQSLRIPSQHRSPHHFERLF